jgi:hypothetical protein
MGAALNAFERSPVILDDAPHDGFGVGFGELAPLKLPCYFDHVVSQSMQERPALDRGRSMLSPPALRRCGASSTP